MIVDTSFFEPLYQLEKKSNFGDLFAGLIELHFDKSFYEKMGLYYDYFHGIYAPISICFLLNYYYGIENKICSYIIKAKNLLEQKKASSIRYYYEDKLDHCYNILKQRMTYEQKFGEEKAKIIKNKISNSMKNLKREIIKNRNESIKQYASTRPESHNKNISISRKKKLFDKNSMKLYNSIKEAVKDTGICETYIRQACQGKRNIIGYSFSFYKEK